MSILGQPVRVIIEPGDRAEPVPDDPHTVGLASTIRKVTVFSDRALVTREAAAKVGAEPAVYAFRHLPGWVDEGSVRAAASAGRILDVRVGRTYLARASDPGYRKAESEARALGARMAELDDELAVLVAQAKQVEDVIFRKLTKQGKGIILMHDFHKHTAEALPDILKRLKTEGYKVVAMRSKVPVQSLPQYDEAILKESKLPTVSQRPVSSVVTEVSQ